MTQTVGFAISLEATSGASAMIEFLISDAQMASLLLENRTLFGLGTVLGLFVLFYLLPGSIVMNRMLGDKEKFLENSALSVLLSLVLTPLILTQLSRAFPSNDFGLVTGFVAFCAIAFAGTRLFRRRVQAWLPDFGALPKADKGAWLLAALVTAAVLALRISIFRGFESSIGDDHFHLSKLTSIAATGLPSSYARQPLYAFSYYDHDYIVPGLWVRYSGGTVGIAQAWVIHIGIQTFVIAIFLSRLLYIFVRASLARFFGLLAMHLGTGLDLLFFLQIEGQTHLESWPVDLKWFDGFVQIQMPFGAYAWTPQHVLGVAIVGLIGYLTVVRPLQGAAHVIAFALLMAALFRTSTFVFFGLLPGLAIWYLYSFIKYRDRIRQFLYHAASALVTGALVLPTLIEHFEKKSILQPGLRPVVFLEVPWLKYPLSVLLYLSLEMGVLLPLLLWAWMRPFAFSRLHRFWLFLSVGLLLPFVVRTPLYNDVAMRGAMPAQLAAVVAGCSVLFLLEQRKRLLVVALVAVQLVLSTASIGADLYFRFSTELAIVPQTSLWIARHVPHVALVFFEQDTAHTSDRVSLTEVTHSRRMAYLRDPTLHDFLYSAAPPSAWRCLPEVDLYAADSLCSIAAMVPGDRPVFVKYLSSKPALDDPTFVSEYETESGSVYSLSCPSGEMSKTDAPPTWLTSCGESPWTIVEWREPLAIDYDGGISLQEIAAYPEGGGGAVLKWVTVHKNETVFAVSFRLYSTNDERVFQQDAILWNQFTGDTSSRGHPRPFRALVLFDFVNAAPFLLYDQTIPLDFPDELSPGLYELRLTVYDAETLQEKVELGSWKPEIVLARLQYSPQID